MSSNDLEKRTVLVIDDSEIILQVTRGALEAAGYRVITRSRAAGSVALLLHEKPHLVLLDVNMPTTSGDTLARVFGKAQSGVETIILLHSTLPSEVLRAKAEASGAHGYIQKTGDLYALVRQVNRWVKTHPSSGRLRSAAVATSPESGSGRSSGTLRAVGSLPRDDRSAAEPPSRPARTEAAPATVVLFVDEDMAILSEFRRLAQGLESIVEFALSGMNAWRKIQGASAPDVVVCGIKLSDLPAAELYRRASALDASWRERFVFVLGAGETGQFSDAPTLRYPIDVRRMRDAIRGGAAHSPRRR